MKFPRPRPARHGRRWTARQLTVTAALMLLPLSLHAEHSWQQVVNYDMDVTLRDAEKALDGTARITYINHSPDTLSILWFRLPPAALRGGSTVDRHDFPDDAGRFSRVPEKNWGNLVVSNAQVVGRQGTWIPDGSVAQFRLEPALLPGDTASLVLEFTTEFPTGGAAMRIAWQRGQYKGAYWYPMICPYTPEYGWTVNRYYGTGEAYGEFGYFTVNYHVPDRFIVASTGELVNQDVVLPPDRLQGLSLTNPDPIPVLEGPEGDRMVTWTYRAEQVPDVAFAMDPTFLIDRADGGSFEAWTFARRGDEEGWQGGAELCVWTIHQLEDIYGPYPWPRVMATDSWSAMEYPMLTMMSTRINDGVEYVLMHEVIHNYTPMILHSNSVDAQALDEGFTTFVEHILSRRYAGKVYDRQRTYTRGLFSRTFPIRDDVLRGRRPYLEAVLAGEDLPMIRGGDVARDYPLLRASTYYKTPVMLNALRYVVGEDAFWRGMRVYYRDNALSHPDEYDMIRAFEEGANRPLGWFFRQFLTSSDDIDYGVAPLKVAERDSGWHFETVITRPGGVRLPLRLGVVLENGDTLRGEVPFLPSDPILPGYARWGSWDQLHEPRDQYDLSMTIQAPSRPVQLLIDPDDLLVDRNPLNNASSRPPVAIRLDPGLLPMPEAPVDRYLVTFGPRLGYNERWGIMPGVRLAGSFMERLHRFEAEGYFPLPSGSEQSPQGRFRLVDDVPGMPRPIQGVLYTGYMHDDQWVEGGITAQWRTWRDHYSERKAALVVGTWEESGLLDFSGRRRTHDYLHLDYAFSRARQQHPISLQLGLTYGLKGSDFLTWEVVFTNRIKDSGRWRYGVAARVNGSSYSTPSAFRPTSGGAARFAYLGDPVFGGPLQRRRATRSEDIAMLDAPASLVSFPLYQADQMALWSIRLNRGFAPSWSGMLLKPMERLVRKTRVGLFHTGATFHHRCGHDDAFDLPLLFEPMFFRLYLEAGVEVVVEDFYGLDMRVRTAPIQYSGGLGVYEPSPNIVLALSYSVPRFYR